MPVVWTIGNEWEVSETRAVELGPVQRVSDPEPAVGAEGNLDVAEDEPWNVGQVQRCHAVGVAFRESVRKPSSPVEAALLDERIAVRVVTRQGVDDIWRVWRRGP